MIYKKKSDPLTEKIKRLLRKNCIGNMRYCLVSYAVKSSKLSNIISLRQIVVKGTKEEQYKMGIEKIKKDLINKNLLLC